MSGGVCCGGLIHSRMSFLTTRKQWSKPYSWDVIAWFIIFLILYVYFISQHHDGDDLAGVFIKRLNLFNVNMKSQITLTNLTFIFLSCWSVLSPLECVWLCFPCTANVWHSQAFSLDTNRRGVLLEKTWVEHAWKPFPCALTLSFVWLQVELKSQVVQRVWLQNFNPGQCWSHGGGITLASLPSC